jgi:hypothetical protein
MYCNIMKNREKEAELAWRNCRNVRLNAEPKCRLLLLRKVALSPHADSHVHGGLLC